MTHRVIKKTGPPGYSSICFRNTHPDPEQREGEIYDDLIICKSTFDGLENLAHTY